VSQLEFEVHAVGSALEELIGLYQASIPETLQLTAVELNMLSQSSGFAMLCWDGNKVVGGAYAMRSTEVEGLLQEADPDFEADNCLLYIYSVVVHPDFRRRGIGSLLRNFIIAEAKNRKFRQGCTHIRTTNNWHLEGRKVYKPYESRTIKDFWLGEEEPDVEFQLFIL
jgi:GNAT superfamily N-acetyltransferase